MFFSEWRKWLDRAFGRGKRAPYRRPSRQPSVEALEPRWVPSFSGVTPKTIAPQEMALFSGTVASFTTDTPGDTFTATIRWGDGPTTPGTITNTGPGAFDVSGSHTYKEDAASLPITVQINDLTDGTTVTANSTANVAEGSFILSAGGPINTPEGQPVTAFQVGTFSDPGSPNAATDFTATIDWGDGTTTAGTITGVTGSGTFTVTGSHTYADELSGTYVVTVTEPEANFNAGTVGNTVTVAEGDFGVLLPQTITATEGTAFSGTVASFTDPGNPSQVAGDFTATIDWGDGTTTAGTVSGSTGGPFDISGSHTYADEGTFTVIATFSDDPPSTLTGIAITSSAVVSEADALTGTGLTVTSTEGGSFTGDVATFTDTNTANVAADFTATINWGDGTTTAGTVAGSQGGPFTVSGTHTYAEDGSYVVTSTMADDAPGSATATATGTANVQEFSLSITQVPISTTEGTSFSGTVAFASDPGSPDPASEFSATIDWGDGTTTAGTVTGTGGNYTIAGGHAYADEGTFTATVTFVENNSPTFTISNNDPVTVLEGDVLTAPAPASVSGAEGDPNFQVSASFTDSNTANTASDFTGTIDWGDGTTTAGTVSGGSGSFTVSGTHAYADEGVFTASVTLADDAPGTATATFTATTTVTEADSLVGTGLPVTSTEGSSFTGNVATFTDTNTANVAADFTATIDWGDGTTTAGTVSGGSGSFTVSGNHTYAEDGTFAASVVLADDAPGTASATATTTANVAEDAFVASGVPINGFERTALGNVTVATFTHANGTEPTGAFTATINWGDGTSSTGTVTQAIAGGEYTVTGSHTYLDEPNPAVSPTFAVAVSITDDTGSTTANSTATILEELLPGDIRGTTNQRWLSEVYRDLLARQIDPTGLASWGNLLDMGVSRSQIVLEIENDSSNEYRTDRVEQLYVQYLHRMADPAGLNGGVAFFQAGGTDEQLAAILAGSTEYFQTQGGGTNDGFLAAFYMDALGRPIDPAGAAGWGALLSSGTSRTQVAFDILSSDEYHRHLVTSYYNTLLDRPPDPGSAGWVNALNMGERDESIIASIAASPEFFNKTVP